jgi:hypothetical protein
LKRARQDSNLRPAEPTPRPAGRRWRRTVERPVREPSRLEQPDRIPLDSAAATSPETSCRGLTTAATRCRAEATTGPPLAAARRGASILITEDRQYGMRRYATGLGNDESRCAFPGGRRSAHPQKVRTNKVSPALPTCRASWAWAAEDSSGPSSSRPSGQSYFWPSTACSWVSAGFKSPIGEEER